MYLFSNHITYVIKLQTGLCKTAWQEVSSTASSYIITPHNRDDSFIVRKNIHLSKFRLLIEDGERQAETTPWKFILY